MPSPNSTGAIIGSPAISPHTVTGMFAAFAAFATIADQPDQRRMQRLVEVRDVLVHAIDRHRVLDEVVRADREEVALGGEQVGGQRRRRHLDHDAELDVLVERRALGVELAP